MQDACCSESGTACCIWVELNANACKRVSQGRQVETHHLSASVSDGKKSSSFIDIPINLKEVRLEKSSGYASHSTIQNGMFF